MILKTTGIDKDQWLSGNCEHKSENSSTFSRWNSVKRSSQLRDGYFKMKLRKKNNYKSRWKEKEKIQEGWPKKKRESIKDKGDKIKGTRKILKKKRKQEKIWRKKGGTSIEEGQRLFGNCENKFKDSSKFSKRNNKEMRHTIKKKKERNKEQLREKAKRKKLILKGRKGLTEE